MYRGKNILAIIPARSGSKGLVNKNIKILKGKHLIGYTIEAANNSNIFDNIIVSTDSKEYADISMSYGAEVPFLREKDLAGDEVSTNYVIVDLLKKLKKLGKEYDSFMVLQPTSPLRDENDIINAFELFVQKNANSVVSMCECEYSPLLSRRLDVNGCLDGFLSGINKLRRQDLKSYYRLNGAIYLSKVEYFLKYKDFYKKDCYAYIMNKEKSVDIDDDLDFKFAEFLLSINQMKGRQ